MRYAIYDGKSTVYTPAGDAFTAEQWLNRYPWAKDNKMIVGGGVINGSVAIAFDDYLDILTKKGADFSACKTDEEYLKAIEEFEDSAKSAAQSEAISNQERIANALEDLVALNMTDVTV